MPRAPKTRLIVLSKPGCHLCEDACAIVARVADDLAVEWEERNILDDAALLAQWSEYIPVVLVDGEVHDVFRVSEDRLRAALSNG